MQFSDLYSTELTRLLGSSDTTARFTTVRRKDAVNEAQRWFVEQTSCLVRTEAITLVDDDGVYDLDAEIADADFLWIMPEGPEVAADPGSGGTVIYYAGETFPRRTVAWLNRHEPGWRTATAGVPQGWYELTEGGLQNFCLYPVPDIPAGATWTLNIPYAVKAAVMSADADEPFSISSNPLKRLFPWHLTLAKYAAHQLEMLRKDKQKSDQFLADAMRDIADFNDKVRPVGGSRIVYHTDYRRPRRGIYYPYDNLRT